MLGTRRRRLVAGGTFSVIVLAVMTGCDPVDSTGPIAATVRDDSLVLTLCEEMEVESVLAEQMGEVTQQRWRSVFEAIGSGTALVGEIDLARQPEGLDVSSAVPLLVDPGGRVSVQVVGVGVSGKQQTWRIKAPFDSVPDDGRWLRSDGSVYNQPCE